MDKKKQLDKVRGSLIGGAVGDALGYPVEFIYSYEGIQKRYGENGINRLDTSHWWKEVWQDSHDKAWVSDDTQMTLFTACGMLNAKTFEDTKCSICEAYLEWFLTQTQNKKNLNRCWIKNIPKLNERRAPGHTCLSALNEIFYGRESFNNSKGCGGIMRTAPVALYGAVWRNKSEGEQQEGRISNINDVDMLAADAAEITHQHPLGWLPSALEAHVIYRLLQNDNPTVEDFKAYLEEGYETLGELYPKEKKALYELMTIIENALLLVDSKASDVENIEKIGEGWVAEETLAIAIYCTVKYFDNFEKAVVASVNHQGDSDSTGAVTGNLLGAVVGYDAIPQHFKDDLELHDVILHVADDLFRGETTKYNEPSESRR